MHVAPWFWFSVAVLLSWGVVGLLQKLSTNRLSGESATIWLIVGFLLFQPLIFPGKAALEVSFYAAVLGVLGGLLNSLGAWALLEAMHSGGKASVVAPFTAMYPIVVVLVAPLLLHETVTLLQGLGVLCGLAAVALLSS
ncbi:MAG TPA: EamA family transporter [Terriglobales bacterium]|nr:EamA family transporter [Terriglobales bacterium]